MYSSGWTTDFACYDVEASCHCTMEWLNGTYSPWRWVSGNCDIPQPANTRGAAIGALFAGLTIVAIVVFLIFRFRCKRVVPPPIPEDIGPSARYARAPVSAQGYTTGADPPAQGPIPGRFREAYGPVGHYQPPVPV
jgi:hypothetical protein